MDCNSPEICKICNKSMIDAKILPCAHSFCLECLKSSIISEDSSTCPTCQISFQIPVGGLNDLKNNEFVEKSKVCRESLFACDGCTEAHAVKFCVECSYNYCSTCLEHHKIFPATANHLLQEPRAKPSKTLVNDQYPACEEHSERINLYCDECHVCICARCLTIKHNTHKMKHISEYFHAVRNDLEKEITKSEMFLQEVLDKYKVASRSLHLNMLSASELKEKIHKRGEDVKKEVDFYVTNLVKTVDKEMERYKKMAENVFVKLKDMETKAETEIQLWKENLKNINYLNMKQRPSVTFNRGIIPDFMYEFSFSLCHGEKKDEFSLEKVIGTLHKDYKYKNMKMGLSKEGTLFRTFDSLTSSKDHIFLSYCSQICEFNHNEISFKKRYNLHNLLNDIIDLLIFGNNLIALGKPCGKVYSTKLFKVDLLKKSEPLEILALKDECCTMSKSYFTDILLSFSKTIVHLSENGDVVKTMGLSFAIDRAIQIDARYYCCYNHAEGILLIDDHGHIIMKYSPSDVLNVVKNPMMTSDNFGRIFLCDSSGNFLTLDFSLNLVLAHKIGRPIHKIHYNRDLNRLIFLTSHRPNNGLITFDL